MFEKIKCLPIQRSIANRKEILNQCHSLKDKRKKEKAKHRTMFEQKRIVNI
jgi:hypothetical protein